MKIKPKTLLQMKSKYYMFCETIQTWNSIVISQTIHFMTFIFYLHENIVCLINMFCSKIVIWINVLDSRNGSFFQRFRKYQAASTYDWYFLPNNGSLFSLALSTTFCVRKNTINGVSQIWSMIPKKMFWYYIHIHIADVVDVTQRL